MTSVSRILKYDYSKVSDTYELEQYIRILKKTVKEQQIALTHLLEKETPLKHPKLKNMTEIHTYEIPDKNTIIEYYNNLQKDKTYFITLNYDPQLYPAAYLSTETHLVSFYKKIIQVAYSEKAFEYIAAIEVGSLGKYHLHMIANHYDIDSFIQTIKPILSNRTKKNKKSKAYYDTPSINIKYIDDFSGCLDYLLKDDFITFTSTLFDINSLSI